MVATKTLNDLTRQLNSADRKAGQGNRSGAAVLAHLAILALTVSTWIALIMAGGVSMFIERNQTLSQQSPPPEPPEFLQFYIVLALIACAFVIPSLISLVAQSAVLGASIHEQRLATLRLIGLSNADVTRMALMNTARQAVVGLAAGTLLAVLTAPAWSLLSFQGIRISTWEMLLPWWGYPLMWLFVLMLALLAACVGLRRVMITPLGVSRREIPKALRWWRVPAFVVVVGGGILFLKGFDLLNSDWGGFILLTVVLLGMVLMLSIVAPFELQLLGRLSSPLPGRINFVAVRRVATNGRLAWRRVGAIAFLAVLLGYYSLLPDMTELSQKYDTITIVTFRDIRTGCLLTFIVGTVIVLVAAVLAQSSAIYEEAQLTRSLDFVGTPRNFHRKVAFRQSFIPMAVVSGCGYALGAGMAVAMIDYSVAGVEMPMQQAIITLIVFIICILVLSGVSFAVDPLRQNLLQHQSRQND